MRIGICFVRKQLSGRRFCYEFNFDSRDVSNLPELRARNPEEMTMALDEKDCRMAMCEIQEASCYDC